VHDVRIREARPEDAEALASLAGELGYPSTADQIASRLSALPDDVVLVAELGGAVAGWMQVGVVRSLESGTFAEVRGLVVTAAHRSSGIGARLVAAGEEWASGRGLTRMRVRSNVVRERTHAFYERHGYRTIKAQKVFDKPL